MGCSHGGQIDSGVGCSWRSNWLRDGSFTRSQTHGGLIYFAVAPTFFVLHCKCGVDLKLASECGVELCLSLVGAWGGVEVSLEMNFGPCEKCV